jgi:hypothetical protein
MGRGSYGEKNSKGMTGMTMVIKQSETSLLAVGFGFGLKEGRGTERG